MKAHVPTRSYRAYAFVTEQIELEREPSWIVNGHKLHVNLFKTVYCGIYGFTSTEERDKFIRRVNKGGKMKEIAHVCSLVKED